MLLGIMVSHELVGVGIPSRVSARRDAVAEVEQEEFPYSGYIRYEPNVDRTQREWTTEAGLKQVIHDRFDLNRPWLDHPVLSIVVPVISREPWSGLPQIRDEDESQEVLMSLVNNGRSINIAVARSARVIDHSSHPQAAEIAEKFGIIPLTVDPDSGLLFQGTLFLVEDDDQRLQFTLHPQQVGDSVIDAESAKRQADHAHAFIPALNSIIEFPDVGRSVPIFERPICPQE